MGRFARRLAPIAALALAFAGDSATADFTHTYVTDAQATVEDKPGGAEFVLAPPILNAYVGDRPERRGIVEYDIRPLAGIALTGATLNFLDDYLSSDYSDGQNALAGFYGDGEVTVGDFGRTDFLLGSLPAGQGTIQNPTLDVLAFVQAAIDAGRDYVGFVFYQTANSSGATFEAGTSLTLSSLTDFTVPPPLPPPFTPPVAVPEPSSMALAAVGIAGLAMRRRKAA